MVTIGEALELIKAGFTVEDIRAMDKPADTGKETKTPAEAEAEKKPTEVNQYDARLDKLTGIVENLVESVGKLPFAYNMGKDPADDADAILASIINPPKKEGK